MNNITQVLPVTTAKRKDVHKPDLLAQKPVSCITLDIYIRMYRTNMH